MPDNARISVRIRIEPIDVLFRDARPFGTASRASSGLPTPQTLAGALRTLCRIARAAGQFTAQTHPGKRQHR